MTEPGTGRQHSEREERAKRAPQPRTNGQHSQREERAKRAPQPRTNGQLVVLLGGHRAGVVSMGTAGRLEFRYDDAWTRRPDATAMSLSLPLGVPVHGDPPVRAYLWGLLPDNEQVLDR